MIMSSWSQKKMYLLTYISDRSLEDAVIDIGLLSSVSFLCHSSRPECCIGVNFDNVINKIVV
jgi:hypothetical protein